MTIPRPAEGAATAVQLSTPLAILGMLVAVVRERFKAVNYSDPERPWFWIDDPASTGLFIESGWNENIESRTVRPGVWIDCVQHAYRTSGIGRQDQMPEVLQHTHARHHSFAETEIGIDCTARKRGESILLGSMVQDFIQASTTIIARDYGLRQISDTMLTQARKFDKDDTLWSSRIEFRVYYEIRWGTIPVQNILHEVAAQYSANGDPEASFLEIAVRQEFEPPE